MKHNSREVVKFISRMILFSLYRVQLIDKHNIPDTGAALLCANHIGEMDMFLLGCRLKRWVYYMAKEELFKMPVIGLFMKWSDAFPVKRGRGDIGAIKAGLKLLKQGHIVGIFPEGTRTKRKSNGITKAKPGAALLAINSDVPIIPVCVKGSYKPFSKMTVMYGKPFNLEINKEKKYSSKELSEISKEIMKKIYSLWEEK